MIRCVFSLLVVFISVQGCSQFTRELCPPDNYPVYVPKNCTEGFEIYAKAYEVRVNTAVEVATLKASNNIEIVQKIKELAEQLNQSTVRYRTTFVGLCQSGAARPCDRDLQFKILEVRTDLAKFYEEVSGRLEKVSATLTQITPTISTQEIQPIREQAIQELDSLTTMVKDAGQQK